jgi:predicted transcriptional regulator
VFGRALEFDVNMLLCNTYLYYGGMLMSLTVRLTPRAERMLNSLAKRRQLSRSDVVREALARYETRDAGEDAGARPYDAWLDVIGVVKLGARDSRRTTGEQLTAMLRRQTRARRAR